MRIICIGLCLLLGVAASAFAQPRRAPIASSELSQISVFDYEAGPRSILDLRPTPIVTNGQGTATVEYEKGNAKIEVKVSDLPPPPSLGPYTTYILWALTPDGRATNQGVLAGIEGGKAKLDTEYAAPQFALIVTAEPHFAVAVPSNMMVLYNVGDKVKGRETKVTSLSERADYSYLGPIAVEKNRPAEIVAARYSLEAAEAAGAPEYAARLYSIAKQKLTVAEAAVAASNRSDRKDVPTLAREATIAGEDARREAKTGKVAADAAHAAAATHAAETAAAEAEIAAASAAENAEAAAQRATANATAAAERAEANAATAAERAEANATAAAETAAANATDRERAAQRQELLDRLNKELPTHETDRGLVSEIGGVQFATGTADLSSSARESLARFAGIVASYPGLKFNIEGHTDSTGSAQTNEALSLRRAIAVRDYLIGQHVPASSIDAEGLASSHPIADNETPAGRARNRRVEIGVSGGLLERGARETAQTERER